MPNKNGGYEKVDSGAYKVTQVKVGQSNKGEVVLHFASNAILVLDAPLASMLAEAISAELILIKNGQRSA